MTIPSAALADLIAAVRSRIAYERKQPNYNPSNDLLARALARYDAEHAGVQEGGQPYAEMLDYALIKQRLAANNIPRSAVMVGDAGNDTFIVYVFKQAHKHHTKQLLAMVGAAFSNAKNIRIEGPIGRPVAATDPARQDEAPKTDDQRECRLRDHAADLYDALKLTTGVLCESGDLNNYRNLSDDELGRMWIDTAKHAGHLLNLIDGLPNEFRSLDHHLLSAKTDEHISPGEQQ